ncbi:MAG: iron-sulfur cluster assembly protein, partial [Nitrospirota bacterium]|nr:iron-sulfur cluster assembly protein [Nitrospirota bacterium]
MTQITRELVLEALAGVEDPAQGENVVVLKMVSGVVVKDGNVGFALEVAPSEAESKEPLRQTCEQAVMALPGVTSVTAVLTAERAPGGGTQHQGASPMARGAPAAGPEGLG